MTTPAVDVNLLSAGIQYDRFYINGVLNYEIEHLVATKHVRRQRPESVSSPIRVDGTRAPKPWGSSGGSMAGVRGYYQREVSFPPTVYKYVRQGQLAAPGLLPGNIPYLNDQGELIAIRKALSRFGEAEVQLGAAMKEVKQTASMVGKYYNHANTLTKKLESAVAGSKKTRQQFKDFLKNGWKDVPGAYLEYLFGMKPLADELTNAVQVLQDSKQHGGAFNMTLRGKYKERDVREEPSYQSHVDFVDQVYGKQEIIQISRASLNFQLPDWYWERLPPVTFFREGWEGTSLSFVLDWVLPVNQWLAGWEGTQLRPFFREGSRSTYMLRKLSDPFVKGSHVYVPEPGSGRGEDFSFYRQVITAFPTAELLMSLPQFGATFDLDKLRVGSALLGQRLAKLAQTIARP